MLSALVCIALWSMYAFSKAECACPWNQWAFALSSVAAILSFSIQAVTLLLARKSSRFQLYYALSVFAGIAVYIILMRIAMDLLA